MVVEIKLMLFSFSATVDPHDCLAWSHLPHSQTHCRAEDPPQQVEAGSTDKQHGGWKGKNEPRSCGFNSESKPLTPPAPGPDRIPP